jgi:hypothetical protein
MSYDLYLSPPHTPKMNMLNFEERGESPDPLEQTLNERIVEALLQLHPEFELFTTYDENFGGRRYELNHEKAIQIELVPRSASIHLSYGYSEPVEVKTIFNELRLYAQTIQRFAHYVIYDPQIDAEIDFDTDFDRIVSVYLKVAKWIDSVFDKAQPSAFDQVVSACLHRVTRIRNFLNKSQSTP